MPVSHTNSYRAYPQQWGIARYALIILLFSALCSHAARRNVDADGEGDYLTLADAFSAAATGDTIYIMGSDVDSYDELFPANVTSSNHTLSSNQSDPDHFPSVRLTGPNYALWWNNLSGSTVISRIRLNDWDAIDFINLNRSVVIRNAVIENTNNTLFVLSGDHTDYLQIDNTFFRNNTGTLFSNPASFNQVGPYGSVINCTFSQNSLISAQTPDATQIAATKYIAFHNSLFYGNGALSTSTLLPSLWTYNLVPTSQTNWGSGTVYNDSPLFLNTSGSYSFPSDFALRVSSPAVDAANLAKAPSIDIRGEARPYNTQADIGAWEYSPPYGQVGYTWDVSTTAGFQAGNGTWGTDHFWSNDGTTLGAWPGASFNANFLGNDGSYAITLNGNQYPRNLYFGTSGYTLSGGTLMLGNGKSIKVESGKSATIQSPITGNFTKVGAGKLELQGDNSALTSYTHTEGDVLVTHANALGTGSITMNGNGRIQLGTTNLTISRPLTISSCAPGVGQGVIQNFGSTPTWAGDITLSANCANGGTFASYANSMSITGALLSTGNFYPVHRAGTVIYSGGGNATRFILIEGTARLGTHNGLPQGSFLMQSDLTRTSQVNLYGFNQTFSALASMPNANTSLTNNQAALSTLTLDGSIDTVYNGIITGNLALVKTGPFQQTLSGINTYTGNTFLNNGRLHITGSLDAASTVTVSSGATLSGDGTIAGSITVSSNGTLEPGNQNADTLFTGSLQLLPNSLVRMELGIPTDYIAVQGSLDLSGKLRIQSLGGLTVGTYPLMSISGAITDNGMSVDSLEPGFKGSIVVSPNLVSVSIRGSVAITSNGGGSLATISVPENQNTATIVSATEEDGQPVRYRLLGGDDLAAFQIDSLTGSLAFSRTPNFELPQDANRDNIYQVTVGAAYGQFVASQNLQVQITNANDPPILATGNAMTWHNDVGTFSAPDSPTLRLYNSFTLEAWIKLLPTGSNQAIITKRNGTANQDYVLGATGTQGQLYLSSTGASFATYYGSRSVVDSSWHHVAASFDGSTLIFWVDGVQDTSMPASGSLRQSIGSLCVGSYNNFSGNGANGNIDEVRIWNIARNATQIRENFHRHLQGNEDGLRAYYTFDEGIGKWSLDHSGNGNTLTMSGTLDPIADWFNSTSVIPYIAPEDSSLLLSGIGWDADGDPLAITILQGPRHGTAQFIEATSSILYTPAANYFGLDTLTVQVSDGQSTLSSDLSIRIFNVPDPPRLIGLANRFFARDSLGKSLRSGVIAIDSLLTLRQGTDLRMHVPLRDSQGEPLLFGNASPPLGAQLVLSDTAADWNWTVQGIDTALFVVYAVNAIGDTAWIRIRVVGFDNQPPYLQQARLQAFDQNSVRIFNVLQSPAAFQIPRELRLIAEFRDPEGDAITVSPLGDNAYKPWWFENNVLRLHWISPMLRDSSIAIRMTDEQGNMDTVALSWTFAANPSGPQPEWQPIARLDAEAGQFTTTQAGRIDIWEITPNGSQRLIQSLWLVPGTHRIALPSLSPFYYAKYPEAPLP